MDVDEMFAIEEEVVVDPDESIKKSMRKLEKKRDKKRKWRRKKRERLRQNEGKLNEEDKSIEHNKKNDNFDAVKTMEYNYSTAKLFETNTDSGNNESSLLKNWKSIKDILQACKSMEQNLNQQQVKSGDVQKELDNTKDETQEIEASLEKDNKTKKLPNKYDTRTKAENGMNVRHDSHSGVIVEEHLKPGKPNNFGSNTDNIEDGRLGRENTDTKGLEADIQGTMDGEADNFDMDLKKELIFQDQSNFRYENTEFKADTMDLCLNDENLIIGSSKTDTEETTTQKTDLATRIENKSREINEQSHSSYLNAVITNQLILAEAEAKPIIQQEPFVKDKIISQCNPEKQNVDVISSNKIPCKSNDETTEQSVDDINKLTPVETMDQDPCDLENKLENQYEFKELKKDNNDVKTGDCESYNTREDSRSVVTISGIMEEVQRTESELKEAGILLGNSENRNIYPNKPNSILQSNVMAMEFDEGSQDSVMFDRVRREMGVQSVTLHHKIMYGMEERRDGDGGGVLKADCDGHRREENVNYDTHVNISGGNELESSESKVNDYGCGSFDDGRSSNGEDIGSDSDAMEEEDSLTVGDDDSKNCSHENHEGEDFGYGNVGGSCFGTDCTIGEKDDYGSSDVGYKHDGNEGDNSNCDSTVAYCGEVIDKAEVGDNYDNGENDITHSISDSNILGLGEVTEDYSESNDDPCTCESTYDDGTSIGDNGDRCDDTPAAREKLIDGARESTSHDHEDSNSVSTECDSGTRTIHVSETKDGNDGDSTYDVSSFKGADDNCKEKHVNEKGEGICSTNKEDENKEKDEKYSNTKMTEETEDVSKSLDIVETVKQENVEGKEEGELSSSSDEENLKDCKDVGKEKKQQKADLASKSDKKNLDEKLESAATTSKKTHKDGVKQNGKRRHSISCTRESSELKGKSDRDDGKRGQKFKKERRRSLIETRDKDEDRSLRKDKTESSKVSLSKARKYEKEDNNKPIKERRSSSTSQKRDEKEVQRKDSSHKAEMKEKTGNRKSLSKETESKEGSKRRSSIISQKRDEKEVQRKDFSQKAETKEKAGNKKSLSKETESKESSKRVSSSTSQKLDEKEVQRKDSSQKDETKEKTGNKKSLSQETESMEDSKRRSSSTSQKRDEKEVQRKDSLQKAETKEKDGNKKSLSKETENKEQSKTTEKTRDIKYSQSKTRSKSDHDKHSNQNDPEKKVNKAGNDNSLAKNGKDSCGKQQKQTEKGIGLGGTTSREHQTHRKESEKRENRSSSESSSNPLSRNKEKESENKCKTQVKKSGYEDAGQRTKRKGSTSSDSSSKHFSDSSKNLKIKPNEMQGQQKDVKTSLRVCKDRTNGNDKSSVSEIRRSSRESVKTRSKTSSENNTSDRELRNQDSTKIISKAKDKTNADGMTPGRKSELKKRDDSATESQGSSSTELKQSFSKKAGSCKTEERQGKKGSIGETSLRKDMKTREKVSCKNEDLRSKSDDKSTDNLKKSSLKSDNSCRTENAAKKEGSTKQNSLKSRRDKDTLRKDDSSSSVERKQPSSKKGDSSKTGERKRKTGSIEKASLGKDMKTKEKVSCKNEDLRSKSKGKSTDNKEKSSLGNDNSCRSGKTDKEGSIQKDSSKKNTREKASRDDDTKSEPLKKEIVSKKSSNKRKDETKIEKSTAEERSSFKEAKPKEDKKLKSENHETCSRTRRSVHSRRDSSGECKTTKIHTIKNLESSKEKPCKPDEGTGRENKIKQKGDGLKTSEFSIRTETLAAKEAVAKRKLTVEEYKSKDRSVSKDTLKSEEKKTSENKSVNNKTDKSKQSEKLPKLKSQKQIRESSEEKLLGKRKREDTPERPQKLRKTTKIDTTKESVKCVKTKEAKLPGNVVTVRILKVDRGKALVLKRRHVNQLFIRGDNVIMVAYENVEASEVKL